MNLFFWNGTRPLNYLKPCPKLSERILKIYNWNCSISLSILKRFHFHWPGIEIILGLTINVSSNYRPEATAEEELIELQKPLVATQWNAALYDDECLIVIPGSHRRPRTEDERRINLEGDFKGTMPRYFRG